MVLETFGGWTGSQTGLLPAGLFLWLSVFVATLNKVIPTRVTFPNKSFFFGDV